jgi:photosystem II stability/assembly factor-like uncharacterized protein
VVKRVWILLLLGCSPGGGSDDPGTTVLTPVWRNQQRSPTSSHLRGVRFINATTGWIVGDATSIFFTTDGGASWTQQEHTPIRRTGDLRALDVSGTLAHAVGADGGVGRVYVSNEFEPWATLDVATTGFDPFVAVDVTGPSTGHALTSSGTVRSFSGNTITSASVGDAGPWFSISHPFVCGAAGKIRKTDGTALASGVATDLRRIFMVDATNGYVVGDAGVVLRTQDGTNWTPKSPGPATTWRGAFFLSATTGWVVGNGGAIQKTTTSGDSWAAQASGTTVDLYDVWFVDANTGWAVGDFGVVLKTVDGGANWTTLTTGTLATLHAVACSTNATTAYAVGTGGVIVKTANGGSTWTNSPSGVVVDLLGVSVPTTGTVAYACGVGGTILKTADGGATWTPQASGVAVTLRAIFFPTSETIGYCVGDASTILKTSDGGANWTPQVSPVASDFHAIAAPGTGLTAFACGTNGKVITTDNFGVTWTDVSPPAAAGVLLQSLRAPTISAVYAGGANGLMYRTFNGGVLWDAVSPGGSNRGLGFFGPNDGLSVNGGIFVTANGGTDWSRSFEHTNWTLRGIVVAGDGATAWVVGDQGTILKTTTGGH